MFEKQEISKLSVDAFDLLGSKWLLLTAGNAEKSNSMTIGWGAFGKLWGRTMATVYVRHSRFSFDLMEKGEYFTLCEFDEKYRPQLQLMGSKSGRDMDKAEACGFHKIVSDCGAVYYEEAKNVFICRKHYADDFDASKATSELFAKTYENGDIHKIYFGEIIEALSRK